MENLYLAQYGGELRRAWKQVEQDKDSNVPAGGSDLYEKAALRVH